MQSQFTNHKSQGSQWPNCFVMLPNEAVQMIDQTLLYTASTRPSENLILMGHENIIQQALLTGSRAHKRTTHLRERINTASNMSK